jgi:hypothetical protein
MTCIQRRVPLNAQAAGFVIALLLAPGANASPYSGGGSSAATGAASSAAQSAMQTIVQSARDDAARQAYTRSIAQPMPRRSPVTLVDPAAIDPKHRPRW